MARGETMGKWLSINEISKTLDIPGTTVRRYRNKFPEYIENKGTTLDGVRKYPESILRVVKQIYGLYQDGKRTSEIKAILMQAVDNEDRTNPLTDDELMSFLKDKGYPIARRTVAKYRQQLNIPVARLRKQIK